MKLLPAPKLKEYPIDFFAQEIFYRISKYNGNVGEYIQYKVSKNVKEKLQERVNDKLKEKNKYEKSKEITNDNNENIKEEFLKRIKEILGESSIEVELD